MVNEEKEKEAESYSVIANTIVNSTEKRIVVIRKETRVIKGSESVWYQIDVLYRGTPNQEYKHRFMQFREDEFKRIVSFYHLNEGGD